jgi:hypothetical protein
VRARNREPGAPHVLAVCRAVATEGAQQGEDFSPTVPPDQDASQTGSTMLFNSPVITAAALSTHRPELNGTVNRPRRQVAHAAEE